MFYRVLKKLKWHIFIRQWRKKNKHNDTIPADFFNVECACVGNYTYGAINVQHYGNENRLVIGSFCSIGPNVTFLLKDDHSLECISTYPYKVKCLNIATNEAISKGDIIVDDDVWIGYGATIMSGVHIGQGAIVAAGAVVTKDVPPYAIVGGVPAKVIKYRFEPELIKELLKIDYSKLTKEKVEKHIDDLYAELKDKRQLDWMPKK